MLSRPEPFREQLKAILIATEDEQSSRLYFESLRDHLKSSRIIVIADHEGSAPKSVIETAKKAKKDRAVEVDAGRDDPFDEVWVVFDTEGPQNAQRLKEARAAVAQARDLGFRTAVSNPSFEYWLLLHYEYYVGLIPDGSAACKRLRKYVKAYEKSGNLFDRTWDKVGVAITNATRAIRERCDQTREPPCDCHPCTQVHLLIESLTKGN